MSIELRGRGYNCWMHEASWEAVREIAREFGWTPKYEKPPRRGSWGGRKTWLLTDDSARALAKALYRAIHAIETDCLSEPLVELVRVAEIDNLRGLADFAFVGAFGNGVNLD
jgi:hypothetical protein